MELNLNSFAAFPFKGALPSGTYLVGGAVRDALLGRPPHDWDLVTANDFQGTARDLARELKAHLVPLGKPGQPLIRLVTADTALDLTPLEGVTLEEDLQRRDFTINAMAWDLSRNRLADPLKGLQDLKAGIVRRVTPRAFPEDPVRMLRAYRLAAQLRFRIESATEGQIRQASYQIQHSAGERQRDELCKLLALPDSHGWVTAMAASGLLFNIFPELEATRHCDQGRYHDLTVWDHTLAAFRHLEQILADLPLLTAGRENPASFLPQQNLAPPLLKLALLLHDMGKPPCRSRDTTGDIHFIGHERQGAGMAAHVCRRLRLSNAQSTGIIHLIQRHLDPLALYQAQRQGTLRPRGITRFFNRNHPWVTELLLHALADQQGKKQAQAAGKSGFNRFVTHLHDLYRTDFLVRSNQQPLLTGRDLRDELGLVPGPVFKHILNRVEEARLSGEIQRRSEALELARTLSAAAAGDRAPQEPTAT